MSQETNQPSDRPGDAHRGKGRTHAQFKQEVGAVLADVVAGTGAHLVDGATGREVVRQSALDAGSESSAPDDGAKSEPTGALPWIPKARDFFAGDYLESDELRVIGEGLIARWPELSWLDTMRIRYVFKESGGATKGRATLGKCSKPSGMTKYFAMCDFIVWAAADHTRSMAFSEAQMEALVYHELSHCAVAGKDEKPVVVGHDVELFYQEVERYGLWRSNLRRAAQTFEQLALSGLETD